MKKPRRSRLDIAAGGLLLLGFLVGLSVFSYDPADPPGNRIFPPNAQPTNLLALRAPGWRTSFAKRSELPSMYCWPPGSSW